MSVEKRLRRCVDPCQRFLGEDISEPSQLVCPAYVELLEVMKPYSGGTKRGSGSQ